MTAFLSRRRFIAGMGGVAAIGGAIAAIRLKRLQRDEDVATKAARDAAFKAKNRAIEQAAAERLLRTVSADKDVTGALFVGNRHVLSAVASNMNEPSLLKLWEVETGKNILTYGGHIGGTIGIAVTRDGLHALSVGRHDATVKYWDVAKGQELRSFPVIHEVREATGKLAGRIKVYLRSVAFAPDEQHFAVGGWGPLLRLYDLRSGVKLWDYQDTHLPGDGVNSVVFAPDGSFILGTGLETRWVDAASGRKVRSYKYPERDGQGFFCHAASISPKGDLALYNHLELRRIDVRTGADVKVDFKDDFGRDKNAYGIRTIAFSPDGSLALVGGEWAPLALIDAKSGKTVFEFSSQAWGPDVGALAISPNGKIAMVGDKRKGTLSFYSLDGLKASS